MSGYRVIPLSAKHGRWANALIEDRWGSVKVVTRGRMHDTSRLPGFLAVRGDEPVGLATYHMAGDQCEMVSLDSLDEGIGIGTALVRAVEGIARSSGCKRLWLITTNDNLAAVRFYQKRGLHIAAIHLDALDESRRLKPEIPITGIDGIPIRDEIELELNL